MGNITKSEQVKYLLNLASTDITSFMETVFRVRDNKAQLVDYVIPETIKPIFRTGILGDSSARFRIINKARQIGLSKGMNVEFNCIGLFYSGCSQYYVATNEKHAKSWLKGLEQVGNDARVLIDGSRIIDIDSKASSNLTKVIKTVKGGVKKQIEESYVVGLAASPNERGYHGLHLAMDEFDHMNREKDMQKTMTAALGPFVSQPGCQMTIFSSPLSKSGEFWNMFANADNMGNTAYELPVITNWKAIDLSIPLTEQLDKIIMPYHWIDINQLERERLYDVEVFKQERLCIPADILCRYITPELLESSATSVMHRIPQPQCYYESAIDVAKERDITAIVIGNRDDKGIFHERNLFSPDGDYPTQERKILDFLRPYRNVLRNIRIDNTGIGTGLADYLQHSGLRLERLDFASNVEINTPQTLDNTNVKKVRIGVYMAEQFKLGLECGTYRTLGYDEPNEYLRQATRHVLNIEKLETGTRQTKYSGKRNGRDDFFWARAMVNANFNTFKSGSNFMSKATNGFGTTKIRNKQKAQLMLSNNRPRVKRYSGW